MDIIIYADDILLLSRTRQELQNQLVTVDEFGYNNDLKFNSKKTNFMIFNEKQAKSRDENTLDNWRGELRLGGDVLEEVQTMRYLGY